MFIIERKSFEGPLKVLQFKHANFKGGGGGGSSGQVNYPAYVETIHSKWLDHTAVDAVTDSMVDVMNAALGNSPYAGLTAYDPDADIAAWDVVIAAFAAILTGISDTVDWAALHTQAETSIGTIVDVPDALDSVDVADIPAPGATADIVDTDDIVGITDAAILADAIAFGAQIDNEITTKVLPRFRRGMQDIGAVISSAFPIGTAIIEGFRDTDVAKHASGLRVQAAVKNVDADIADQTLHLDVKKTNQTKNIEAGKMLLDRDKANALKDIENEKLHSDIKKTNAYIGISNQGKEVSLSNVYISGTAQMLQLMIQRIGWEDVYTKMYIEAKRLKIVAKKEQLDEDATLDEKDSLWDLQVFQHGGNLLAAPAGGTATNRFDGGPSKLQSSMGGAMSGAAMGYMMAGAQAGGMTGPQGAAIGAGAGLLMGFLMS